MDDINSGRVELLLGVVEEHAFLREVNFESGKAKSKRSYHSPSGIAFSRERDVVHVYADLGAVLHTWGLKKSTKNVDREPAASYKAGVSTTSGRGCSMQGEVSVPVVQ